MSLYIDFPVGDENGNEQGSFETITSAWCKTESVLALSVKGQGVRFYNEEGEVLPETQLERNNSDALVMDWRVRSKVVAVGWEDGAVTLWNVKDKILREDNSAHTGKVTLVKWSPEGGRLLSTDSNGTVAIWRTDHRGRLAVVSKRDVGNGEGICCCSWMLSTEYREAQRDLPTPPQRVFVGTTHGTIVLTNLKGDVLASVRTGSKLRTLSWFEEEQVLVAILEDNSMLRYKVQTSVDDPESVVLENVSKVRLSMTHEGTRNGVSQAIWTSPGLLATCSSEAMVRFWDIPNDASYSITYSSASSVIHVGGEGKEAESSSSADMVTSISFNARTRILAASTTTGKVFLWRFVGEPATMISNGNEDDDDGGESGDGEKENRIGNDRVEKKMHYPPSNASSWESVAILSAISAPIVSVKWGPRESSLCVIMQDKCSIMNETVLHRTLRCDVAALQISSHKILVQRGASNRMETHVGLRVKGIDVNDQYAVVWNQKKAEVYEFRETTMEKISSFPSKAESIALYGETVFQTNGPKLEVCNLQGVSRKDITFSEHEGDPKLLHINGKYLAVSTNKGMIKVFDVSRREPKQIGTGARFVEEQKTKSGKVIKGKPIGEIRSVRCNADGTRVSILCDIVRGQFMCEPDTRIHVWNMDKDEFQTYDFGPNRFPTSHFWDGTEPKLLACEAKRIGKSISTYDEQPKTKTSEKLRGSRLRHTTDDDEIVTDESKEKNEAELEKERLQKIRLNKRRKKSAALEISEIEVVTLFATDERVGVMMQDSFPLDQQLDALLGLKVPRLFFISKPVDGVPKLKGKMMRDFVGLNSKVDDETKRALIDFSYYLTIGNMDEAYKAVKLIENVGVWENMAHMCVKTRRLDVAEMCMGNMGHARGARALRESKAEPEVEAQIAMVAIQLGLLDEAERLYVECGRYDLLNKMLRSSGQWTKALEVANGFDRIHLRETHFDYGRHLESMSDFKAAIANYEASGTHRKQVPRMLFAADRIDDLEMYIQSQCDEELTKWWGQYCESQGEYERAIHVYQRAGDELSLVRLHCFMDNMQGAAEIALNSSDPAASYHLALQCEQRGNINEAIQFYSRAGRYNHAVRLAKEHGFDSEIVNLALRADKGTMIDAARFLESKGLNEDAVVLYQKGGNVPRALDLCFRSELFDLLTKIADTLTLKKPEVNDKSSSPPGSTPREEYDDSTMDSSPEILTRCAEFFIEHGKYDKAVHLYITAGDFETALELCFNHKVMITEEMAESMTLDKMSTSAPEVKKNPKLKQKATEHNERRQRLLESIAKCCKKQQSFHLATKKYTQAGDRLKAMKCLLRSGDTEKIIFFAGVSRSKEIYILAANYLQNLDWRNDPEIMKAIISYYTKAKAFQQLSGFYEACSQMEIDAYRDYDKALGALKEAVKYMGKVQDESLKDEMLLSLQQRISIVERFVHARKLATSDPDEAERICTSLLTHPEVNSAIRSGDVFAMLIEQSYKSRDFGQAHQLVEKMKARGIAIGPYIDQHVLDSIAQAVGVDSLIDDYGRNDDDDEIEDEIEEDLDWGHK